MDDLQQLWRAEARQLHLSLTTIDVKAEIEGVRERFAGQATEDGIMLRLDLSSGPLSIWADQERLAQILDNLASNAIRYSPTGASVVLVATAEKDEVVIGVIDQGPGLTDEQRERVFERFYRIDPSRSRALGGSGIGLAIARALTEAMGGRVWAESEGPGLGSTFRLAFPRA